MSVEPHPQPLPLHMTAKLIVLVGIPGCGKSSLATVLGHPVVSSDQIRADLSNVNDQTRNGEVFDIFHATIGVLLSEGRTVIADSTALDRRSRDQLRSVADVFKAEKHMVYFSNVGVAASRNEERERTVPKDVMQRMLDKYEYFKITLPQESPHWDTITEIRSFA